MLLQQKNNLLLQSSPTAIKFYYCDILTSDYKASDKDVEKPECRASVFTSVEQRCDLDPKYYKTQLILWFSHVYTKY